MNGDAYGRLVAALRACARMLSCTLVACTLASCATAPPSIPREIVYDAARGNWTLISDPAPAQSEASEPRTAPSATSIPIITLIDNQRIEGLMLAPGSPGYERTVRVYTHEGRVEGGELLLPYVVMRKSSGWNVMGVRFSLTGDELLALHAQAHSALIPVTADGENTLTDIGIGRRQGYCGTGLTRRQARRAFGPYTLWPREDRQR